MQSRDVSTCHNFNPRDKGPPQLSRGFNLCFAQVRLLFHLIAPPMHLEKGLFFPTPEILPKGGVLGLGA